MWTINQQNWVLPSDPHKQDQRKTISSWRFMKSTPARWPRWEAAMNPMGQESIMRTILGTTTASTTTTPRLSGPRKQTEGSSPPSSWPRGCGCQGGKPGPQRRGGGPCSSPHLPTRTTLWRSTPPSNRRFQPRMTSQLPHQCPQEAQPLLQPRMCVEHLEVFL